MRFVPQPGSPRLVLGLVLVLMVFNSVDRTVLSIVAQDVKLDLGLDDRQMGWLLGPAFTIFYTLATFPIAAVADRGRRRIVMSVGLFLWSFFTTVTALAQSYWQLLVLRMAVGVGEASSSAPGQSLLIATVPVEQRARSMSVLAIGSVLGLAIGMIVGGFVSDYAGWRMAFVVAGVPGLLFAFVFYAGVREPAQSEQPVSWGVALKTMLGFRTYRWILAAQATALFASMGRNLWEPTFLRRVYEMGAGEAGVWYFFTSPLPSALGIYIGGRVVDKLWLRDRRYGMWVAAGGQIACLPFLAAFLLWPEDSRLPFGPIEGGFPVALLFSVVASVLGSFYAAPMLATTQELAPQAMRARAAALASAITGIVGSGLGPMLVGELNMRFESTYGEAAIRYSLLVVVAVTLISAIGWLGAARPLRADLDSRGASRN